MAGLEELRKKLTPLFDAENGFSSGNTLDGGDSDMLSDGGSINLLSKSYGVYNINELGLQKCTTSPVDETNHDEKTFRCASNEMQIFGTIGSGASSIVQRAIHTPTHRIIALKKINIFEKGIPSKFVEKYGEELSDSVSLNVPTGAVWEVKLVRDQDGRAWLQKGWPEFVDFYSINYCHFLVFRYKGNSGFDVVIFDMSSTEIEYPVADIKACMAIKKRKWEESGSPLSSSEKEDAVPEDTVPEDTVPAKVIGYRRVLTPNEMKRIENYQCKHPAFVVKLGSSHVKYGGTLNIPIGFAQKYIKNELGEFKLHSVTGKTWLVRCIAFSSHVSFSTGWRAFVLDNDLRMNDICVFELIKGAKKTFKFGVLPAAGGKS